MEGIQHRDARLRALKANVNPLRFGEVARRHGPGAPSNPTCRASGGNSIATGPQGNESGDPSAAPLNIAFQQMRRRPTFEELALATLNKAHVWPP